MEEVSSPEPPAVEKNLFGIQIGNVPGRRVDLGRLHRVNGVVPREPPAERRLRKEMRTAGVIVLELRSSDGYQGRLPFAPLYPLFESPQTATTASTSAPASTPSLKRRDTLTATSLSTNGNRLIPVLPRRHLTPCVAGLGQSPRERESLCYIISTMCLVGINRRKRQLARFVESGIA